MVAYSCAYPLINCLNLNGGSLLYQAILSDHWRVPIFRRRFHKSPSEQMPILILSYVLGFIFGISSCQANRQSFFMSSWQTMRLDHMRKKMKMIHHNVEQ